MGIRKGLLVALVMMLACGAAFSANVTFKIDMSLAETLGVFVPESDMVVVRGSMNDWSGEANALTLNAESGLYEGTFDLADGNYEYKHVIHNDAADTWEDGIENRTFNVAGSDVVLDAVFWRNADPEVAVDVTFQVMMSYQEELENFDPENDIVVIRGDMNGWGGNNDVLALVPDSENNTYAITLSLTPGVQNYKFVIPGTESDLWEADPNREYTVWGAGSVEADWFNRQDPTPIVTLNVLYMVDMGVQILMGNFDPATDAVVVRGNHSAIGNWGGYSAVLAREGATDIYAAWINMESLPVGSPLEYKFVIDPGNDQTGDDVWEQPEGGGNRVYTPTGEEVNNEVELPVVYFSDNESATTEEVDVTFIVDMRPAYLRLEDEAFLGDGVGIDGVYINGLNGTWLPWGTPGDMVVMADDGVAPDETAGDQFFTAVVTFPIGSAFSQVYKYSINGLDNEGGVGEDHSFNIPENQEDIVLNDIFGSEGTAFDPWDVREIETDHVPSSFVLEQNYPNPFNPTTSFAFELSKSSDVVVKVFNINGQEVYSYKPGKMDAGRKVVSFDGTNLASGTYIYRVEAQGMSLSRKMVLVK